MFTRSISVGTRQIVSLTWDRLNRPLENDFLNIFTGGIGILSPTVNYGSGRPELLAPQANMPTVLLRGHPTT